MQPVNKISISPGNQKWDIFPPFPYLPLLPVQAAVNALKSAMLQSCAESVNPYGRRTSVTWTF